MPVMMTRLPILLATLALGTGPAQAQPALQTRDQAVAEDAVEYARLHRLAPEEALRRLRAELASAGPVDAVRRALGDRVAGIAIVHAPDFHVRILLTGGNSPPDRVIDAGGTALPIRFVGGARASSAQLSAAIDRHREAIDALIAHSGIGVDQSSGEMVVLASGQALGDRSPEAVAAEVEALTGVPARVRMIGGAAADSGISGGRRVEGQEPSDGRRYFCTTGFVVTDGTRSGIVTAAHCPDSLSYKDAEGVEVPLLFEGGWGAQFQDVQVHVAPTAQAPTFRAGPGPDRPQLDRRLRAATRAGETVCHRGESSGYSCSVVDLTDFAPPGLLCGGLCTPTWVSVAGPSCRSGDSGGPVFAGTTAFGILKGSNYDPDGGCNFYFYMSTDYLPPGWSLLLAEGGPTEDSGLASPD